ncbi:protein of unknown function [Methylacidimicrobium sp. AP8]|nr:protein of unknown function [Methylacidimicrobium sp. AP8]
MLPLAWEEPKTMTRLLLECARGVLLSLWLTAAVAVAEDKPSAPLSPEAQALIQKLTTLRMPATFSFLQTVDPQLFAETLQTPEGQWAMALRPTAGRLRTPIGIPKRGNSLSAQRSASWSESSPPFPFRSSMRS